MIWFRDFTVPLWTLFSGNLMMLVTIVFYIVWWVVSRGDITDSGAAFFITLVLVTGVVAVILLFFGINSLQQDGNGLPVIYILPGAVVFFVTLLTVTTTVFHREVTSELLSITFWAALEGAVIAVLHVSGPIGKGPTLTLAVALVVAGDRGGLLCSPLSSPRSCTLLERTYPAYCG